MLRDVEDDLIEVKSSSLLNTTLTLRDGLLDYFVGFEGLYPSPNEVTCMLFSKETLIPCSFTPQPFPLYPLLSKM